MKTLFNSSLKFRLFLFSRLPAAWFAGLRMHTFSEERCVTRITYGWANKNPFRSMYFACQAMAAEMASGALAFYHVQNSGKPISMLVTGVEASFSKKATGEIHFECQDGRQLQSCVSDTIRTGEGTQVRACSVGKNSQGEEVARFYVTWSFKHKLTK